MSRGTRSRPHIRAELVADSVRITGTAVDISMRGVFLRSAELLPEKTACDVWLFPTGSNSVTCVKGRVVRTLDDGMGVEFTDISHADLEDLRRLV